MTDNEDRVAFKYVGHGEHIPGIPARDVLDSELESLGAFVQGEIKASPLYRVARASGRSGGEPQGD